MISLQERPLSTAKRTRTRNRTRNRNQREVEEPSPSHLQKHPHPSIKRNVHLFGCFFSSLHKSYSKLNSALREFTTCTRHQGSSDPHGEIRNSKRVLNIYESAQGTRYGQSHTFRVPPPFPPLFTLQSQPTKLFQFAGVKGPYVSSVSSVSSVAKCQQSASKCLSGPAKCTGTCLSGNEHPPPSTVRIPLAK